MTFDQAISNRAHSPEMESNSMSCDAVKQPVVSPPRVVKRPILTLKQKPATASVGSASVHAPVTGLVPLRHTSVIRAVCFVDAQNLLKSAEQAFGCSEHANPTALAAAVCAEQGWRCDGVRFYSGVPDPNRDPVESKLWQDRCDQLRLDGVAVYTRRLQYIDRSFQLPDGSWHSNPKIKEKGIDLRIGLDVVEMALQNTFDVAVLFCRDQDLTELLPTVARLAVQQGRTIRLASAYPESTSRMHRGIDGMQGIPISKVTYEACLDQRDSAGPMWRALQAVGNERCTALN
jgi:uncharacterized LabA/DUF88 family protein